jgi:hypothetical protein
LQIVINKLQIISSTIIRNQTFIVVKLSIVLAVILGLTACGKDTCGLYEEAYTVDGQCESGSADYEYEFDDNECLIPDDCTGDDLKLINDYLQCIIDSPCVDQTLETGDCDEPEGISDDCAW